MLVCDSFVMSGIPRGGGWEKLESAFNALFPDVSFDLKTTIGIYSPDGFACCKRLVCLSSEPLILSNYLDDVFGGEYDTPLLWGICKVTPTRTSVVTDDRLLLCCQIGRKLIACGIFYANSMTIDFDHEHVIALLEYISMECDRFHPITRERDMYFPN